MVKSGRRRTYLVTGAAGFIGSHVVEALASAGHEVLAVDNLCEQGDAARKHRDIAQVLDKGRAERAEIAFTKADIRDRTAMEAVVGDVEVSGIVHLAAMPGVGASLREPELFFDVNVNGTICLLQLAAARGVERFVMASSSSVYGEGDGEPFREDMACDRPISPYAASKRACELAGHAWHNQFGFSFTALRYFSVYGPRGRPDMMPYKVLESIFEGRELVLYDEGRLMRDWTFVDDVVAATLAACEAPSGYLVLNVGRGEPVRMSDFVATAERVAGAEARISSGAKPAIDSSYTHADVSLARRQLGFEAKVSLEEGLSRFCRWYRQVVFQEQPHQRDAGDRQG